MARIKHIAFAIEPEKITSLANFYVDVFGMEITQSMGNGINGPIGIWLTDGYMQMALLNRQMWNDGDSPVYCDPHPRGINHYGFTVDDEDELIGIKEKLKKYEVAMFKPPEDRPYVEDAFLDLAGNKVDLTAGKVLREYVVGQKPRTKEEQLA